MATTTQTPPEAASSVDQFVTRRLERAGSQVKIIDLASDLLLIATVVLGALLVVCVIDAWAVSLGRSMRLIILGALAAFAGIVLTRSVIPLLFRRINPAYAARMIEQSEPKFKNSLLNYVFLRARGQQQPRRVFEAVQAKAAQDLSAISIENAIDHSRLIHVGFALVAVTLVAGLYKLVSPKDPFATVMRVIAPLADIQSPSRVRVASVAPGSSEIFFGETISVVADVRGAGQNTPVALMYSTADGQLMNASIPLLPGNTKNEFIGTLTTSDSGIQNSLSYWVAAGDGRSPTYQVTVRPSPTIAVATIDLRPPAYTELPPRHLIGQPDIDAIEGTAVHLVAQTNMQIASATLELLKNKQPPKPSAVNARPATNESRPAAGANEFDLVERIAMQVDDRTARVDFKLLRADAEQKFTHYRLKFATSGGQNNRHDPVYSVRILPDIAPELEVLEPTQNKLRVPLNGNLPIKVRAMDPDFRISAIRLIALRKGQVILEQNLTLDQNSGIGNVRGEYRLRPDAHQLQVGDEVIFHLAAKDNRRSPLSDQPDPNITRSGNFELTITPPLRSDQTNRPDQSNADQRQAPNSDSNSQDDQNNSAQDPNSSGKKSDKSGASQDRHSQSGDQQGGDSSDKAEGNNEKSPDSSSRQGKSQSESSRDSQEHSKQSSGGSQGNSAPQPNDQNSEQNPSRESNSGDQQSQGSNAQPSAANDQNNRPGGEEQNDPRATDAQNSGQANRANERGNSDQSMSENSTQPRPDQSNDPRSRQLADHQNKSGDPNSTGEHSDSASGENAQNSRPAPGERTSRPSAENDSANRSEQSADDRPLDESSSEGERFDKLVERLKREQNKNGQGSRNPSADSQSGAQQDSKTQQSGGEQPSNEANSQDRSQQQSERQPSDQGQPETSRDQIQSEQTGDQQGTADHQQAADDRNIGESNDDGNQNRGTDPSRQQPPRDSDRGQQPSADDPANKNSPAGQPQPSDTPSKPGDGPPAVNDQSSPGDAEANNMQPSPGETSEDRRGSPLRKDMPRTTQFPDSGRANIDFNPPPVTPQEREQLEESRKVTDLVLDYLKDQQRQPNADLLNEMNWTDQELRNFVNRWEKLKTDAAQGDAEAQSRYFDALRSLGLRTGSEQARRARMQRDQIRDLNEDGALSAPPEKFAEAFRDFSKGRAKSGNK